MAGAPAGGAPGSMAGYAPPPSMPAGAPDDHGIGVALERLSSGARKTSRVAALIASALLDDGEVVESLVGGRVSGNGAVLVLTDRKLVLVDDREWVPLVERVVLDASLQVQGWQDDRTASLTLVTEGRQLLIDQIRDRSLAVDLAQRIRYRTGTTG